MQAPPDHPTIVQILTLVISLFGLFSSLCGLLLAIVNFRRDRPRILVDVVWDRFHLQTYGLKPEDVDTQGVPEERQIWMIIHNLGRRPVFIDMVGMDFSSRKYKNPLEYYRRWKMERLFRKHPRSRGLRIGGRLGEGDSPVVWVYDWGSFVNRPVENTFKDDWKYLRCWVTDATGRKHYSKTPTQIELAPYVRKSLSDGALAKIELPAEEIDITPHDRRRKDIDIDLL